MSERQLFTRELGLRLERRKIGRFGYLALTPFMRSQNPDAILRLDELTGLKNRKAFDEDFEAAHGRASRPDSKEHLTLMLLDVDGMKRINDVRGHGEGDRLLRTVSHGLEKHVRRPFDEIYRFSDGGDEFAALFPDFKTDSVSAAETVRRIEQGLKQDILDADFPAELQLGATAVVGALLPNESSQAFQTRLDLELSLRKRQNHISLREQGIGLDDARVINLRTLR